METQAILWGVLIPALVVGIGTLLLSRTKAENRALSFGALLFGLGFALGHHGLFGWPPIPSDSRVLSGTDWLAWMVMASGILFTFEGRLGFAAPVLRWLVGGTMLALVLRATIEYQWEGPQIVQWLAGLSSLGIALWFSTRGLARRSSDSSLPLALLLVLTALAVCSGLSGSAKIAQLTGLLCAGMGALWVASLISTNVRLRSGDVSTVVLGAFGLGLCACFYSELPGLDALLVACGALAPWLAELPAIRNWSPRRRAMFRIFSTLAVVAIPITRTALAFEPDPYSDYGY